MKIETLYQAHVTDRQGKDIAIGPTFDQKAALEPLVERINKMVAEGKERDWGDARIVEVKNIVN